MEGTRPDGLKDEQIERALHELALNVFLRLFLHRFVDQAYSDRGGLSISRLCLFRVGSRCAVGSVYLSLNNMKI